jgi:site-specific recombinase XerD
MTPVGLGSLIHSFFDDYLKTQKGIRPNSLKSYADAMRLFLLFASKTLERRVSNLTIDDLGADLVSRFLNSLEESRGNAVQSRNQRLGALRSFFEYVGRQLPDKLVLAQRVAAIPRKRAQPPETVYLEREEIESTLASLPSTGQRALRDRALLLFLYNSGARVQEVADLRADNIQYGPNPSVHLHGKGDKWRVCPLWEETASLLKRLLEARGTADAPDRPVFTGGDGTALTRFGIYKIVRRHTGQITKTGADGQRRNISPHVWRRSTAVHLLEAGVEVNTIRAWLGHASLETTNRYAEITLRTKQAALEKCGLQSATNARIPRQPVWHSDASLLNWLQSL